MSQPRWGFGKKSSGGTGTVTNVSSTDVTNLTVATSTTTPKITVKNAPTATSAKTATSATDATSAKTVVSVPDTALVAGTRITLATTAGKAKITAAATTEVAMGGDVTGTSTASVVSKVPDTALVAGTRITLATTAGKAKISSSGTGIVTAETSATGVALINGAQTILTATVPNDAKPHQAIVTVFKVVTAALTGGAVVMAVTDIAGTAFTLAIAGTAVGTYTHSSTTNSTFLLKPGTTVTVKQTTAMTAGAAKVYAKIVII